LLANCVFSKTKTRSDKRKFISSLLIREDSFWSQRDTVKAASEFASRNHLPRRVHNQMLAHICLRFKTEGLKQQEALNDLPKAIRSSIAHHLFFPVVQKVYLFQGVSNDFLFQLVIPHMSFYFIYFPLFVSSLAK